MSFGLMFSNEYCKAFLIEILSQSSLIIKTILEIIVRVIIKGVQQVYILLISN